MMRPVQIQRTQTRWQAPAGIVLLGVCLAAVGAGNADRVPALGPERDASQWPGPQAEISIAVDRFHPQTAIAATMNIDEGQMLVVSTSDAGETWSRTLLPFGTGATLDADPWVTFDSRGRAFLAKIPVIGGNYNLGIDVCRSDDGGQTWSPAKRISQAINQDDKLTIVADDNPESPFRDRVYVAWKRPSRGPYVSRSLDRGETYSAPQAVDSSLVTGHAMAVAADGTLYLAFRDYARHTIRVIRSFDGGASFSPSIGIADVRAGFFVIPPSACLRKALVHASVAVDRSDGPDRGRVYVAWPDYPPGISDASCPYACVGASPCAPRVYVSSSMDRGETWTTPQVVHEEEVFSVVDRYHSWLTVDPSDGVVYVAYKDSRNDPSRAGSDVYLSRSLDGGQSWAPSMRVSSATSVSTNLFQFGDYQSMAASAGLVYVAWADSRADSAESEVYVRVLHADGIYSPPRGGLVPVPRRPSPRQTSPRAGGTSSDHR